MNQRRRKWIFAIGAVLVFLVGARLSLPLIVERHLESSINEIPGLKTDISDVSLSVFDGRATLSGVRLDGQLESSTQELLTVEQVQMDVDVLSLLSGPVKTAVTMDRPHFVVVSDEHVVDTSTLLSKLQWLKLLADRFKPTITQFQMHDGSVDFKSSASESDVDFFVTDLNVQSSLIDEHSQPSGPERIRVQVSGVTAGDGKLEVNIDAAPSSNPPAFEMESRISDLNLTALNELFRETGGVDVASGQLDFYSKIKARDGAYSGVLAPTLTQVEVLSPEDKDEGAFEKLKEGIVEGAKNIIEDEKSQQAKTQIAFNGRFDADVQSTWGAAADLFWQSLIKSKREIN